MEKYHGMPHEDCREILHGLLSLPDVKLFYSLSSFPDDKLKKRK